MKTAAPSTPAEPDLPATLVPVEHTADLRGARLEERLVQGVDLSGQTAHDLSIVESRLEDVDLSGTEASAAGSKRQISTRRS